jgi:hypothetical protein
MSHSNSMPAARAAKRLKKCKTNIAALVPLMGIEQHELGS